MNTLEPCWICSVLLATCVYATAATNDFETRFHPKAQLSPDELQQVVALARDCGIESVGGVATYNIHPSSTFGITVKSREQVNGRYEFQKVITVVNPAWQPQQSPSPDVKRRGDFWVDMMPRTITNGVFELRGETFRVKLESGIPVTECDSILSALSANRIAMEPTLDAKKQAQVRALPEIWKPDTLSWRDEKKDYFASYTVETYHWRCIRFRMVDGVVRIYEVSDIVS